MPFYIDSEWSIQIQFYREHYVHFTTQVVKLVIPRSSWYTHQVENILRHRKLAVMPPYFGGKSGT